VDVTVQLIRYKKGTRIGDLRSWMENPTDQKPRIGDLRSWMENPTDQKPHLGKVVGVTLKMVADR
jgi:hypothetical protein